MTPSPAQSDYPLLSKAIEDGTLNLDLNPPPREPRCGPWVDGVCQKCGQPDPLELPDLDGGMDGPDGY